jgi:tetratricopeptide (TPR) repeat protein
LLYQQGRTDKAAEVAWRTIESCRRHDRVHTVSGYVSAAIFCATTLSPPRSDARARVLDGVLDDLEHGRVPLTAIQLDAEHEFMKLLSETGQHPAAIRVGRNLFDRQSSSYGDESKEVATTLSWIANSQHWSGQLATATYEECLPLNERTQGPESQQVFKVLRNWGQLEIARNRNHEARELLERALRIREAHDYDDRRAYEWVSSLAILRELDDDDLEAAVLFDEWLPVMCSALSASNDVYLRALESYVRALTGADRSDDAVSWARSLLAGRTASDGPTAKASRRAMLTLARMLAAADKLEESKHLLGQILRLEDEEPSDDPTNRLRYEADLVYVTRRLGGFEDAAELAEDLLGHRDKLLETEPQLAWDVRFDLAKARLQQGQFDEAARLGRELRGDALEVQDRESFLEIIDEIIQGTWVPASLRTDQSEHDHRA